MLARNLTESDLELFYNYAKEEQWDIEDAHISALLKSYRDDFFAFYEGEKLIGYVVALRESRGFGFISSLLVLKEFRSLGYGREILSFALEHLQERQIALDSLLGQETFYEKFGFQAYFDVSNYRFETGSVTIQNDKFSLIDFDTKLSLENQSIYLQHLLLENSLNYKAIVAEGKIVSFGFALAYKDGYKITLYTEDINHAASLFFALCDKYEKKTAIYMRISQTEELLKALAEALEMQKVEHFTRMYNKVLP